MWNQILIQYLDKCLCFSLPSVECCDLLSPTTLCFVFYRDLKPANILVTNTGQIKLADFGFAIQVIPCDLKCQVFGPKNLKNTTFCGTPCYMAPEILRCRGSYDALPTDIWSLYVACCFNKVESMFRLVKFVFYFVEVSHYFA